jgi:3-oxoacyl-(acyl-carrier-protein) synthase
MTASIAGLGWVTPLGRDLRSVWAAIRENRAPDPTLLESPVNKRTVPVLRVPGDLLRDAASLPRLRRSSVISHLAVTAAVDAVASARMTPEALKRTALVFAASDGGVVYTRRFYADVVERGGGSGSPLLFPETVYNAPASHIAARLGLEGEVLTLVGDAATGLSAVQTGCELLAAAEADYCVIASAQEIDWITCEAYGRWGLIQNTHNSAAVFSEGAAAIVLARESGACQISATRSGHSFAAERFAETMLDAMLNELLGDSQPALAISCASGTRIDMAEKRCLAKRLSNAKILTPKAVLGEALACSTIQQIITGALALEESGGGSALITTFGYNGQLAGLILTHGLGRR